MPGWRGGPVDRPVGPGPGVPLAQPPRPRRPTDPYNPLEEQQLAYMQQFVGAHPDVASQIAPLFFGTMTGAQERFAQNRATRMEGLSQLRQLAMELAAGTASQDAVTAAITGQADLLPGVNPQGRAMEGLEGFVSGLYDEGPVSGLAPYDVRSQIAGAGLDQEDRGAIGQLVIQGLENGVSFREIRENVRRQMVAAGYDEFASSEAMNEAELAYERLIGTSLEELREFGGEFREGIMAAGGNSQELEADTIAEVTGMDPEELAIVQGQPTTEQFLAALVNDPAMYGRVRSGFEANAPSSFAQNDGGGGGGLFGLGDLFNFHLPQYG